MKHLIKYLILLAIGGIVYCGIEILVRGFTHWTMFLVGGICFILIGIINEITPKMPLVRQMLLSAVIITVAEFVSGCILNIWLDLDIWDYRRLLMQVRKTYRGITLMKQSTVSFTVTQIWHLSLHPLLHMLLIM